MKYQRSDRFDHEYGRLSHQQKDLFSQAVRQMNVAFATRGDQALPHWPASLRIREVAGRAGVFEMTWSFAGPDGRATFEYVTIDGDPAIRWRRIGDHRIFRDP